MNQNVASNPGSVYSTVHSDTAKEAEQKFYDFIKNLPGAKEITQEEEKSGVFFSKDTFTVRRATEKEDTEEHFDVSIGIPTLGSDGKPFYKYTHLDYTTARSQETFDKKKENERKFGTVTVCIPKKIIDLAAIESPEGIDYQHVLKCIKEALY